MAVHVVFKSLQDHVYLQLLLAFQNQGVLPTPASMDVEGADGRSGAGDQDTGVRELEVQIDALYGMPSGGSGASAPSPIRVVQTPVVGS